MVGLGELFHQVKPNSKSLMGYVLVVVDLVEFFKQLFADFRIDARSGIRNDNVANPASAEISMFTFPPCGVNFRAFEKG